MSRRLQADTCRVRPCVFRKAVLGAGLVGLLFAAAAVLADQGAAPAAGSQGAAQPQRPLADNSRCFVCHANFDSEDEQLTFLHAKANIGCVRCHGESSPHSTDEDGLTAPDLMWPKSRIRFNCLGCHDWVKLVQSDLKKTHLKEKPDHQAVLDGTAKDRKFCTDCHGPEHRLSHRTRLWDKKTGKLLSRDATPRLLEASPPK